MNANVVAGVDGLGTMNLGVEGWAFFLLPKATAEQFERDAAQILATTTLKAFHGKKYTRRFEEAYREFLVLIRESCTAAAYGVVASILLQPRLLAEFRAFCRSVLTGALAKNGLAADDVVKASEHIVPGLYSLVRLTTGCPYPEIAVIFDSEAATESLVKRVIESQGRRLAVEALIRTAFNAYRDLNFPTSPCLVKDGWGTERDEDSFLLQAADMFGNLSTVYAEMRLGKVSQTTERKAQLFDDVFGDLLADADFSQVELDGHDLRLKPGGGALNLIIRNGPGAPRECA